MPIRQRQSLSEISADIDGFSDNLEKLAELTDVEFQHIAREAFEPIKGVAKDMLVQNFEASNVGSLSDPEVYQSTGKLRSAVLNSEVSLRFKGKEVQIIAFMQPGIGAYETGKSKKSRSDFYTVAASLNFGAVRVPKEKREVVDLPTGRVKIEERDVIGQKAKQTVKKFALGQAVSSRAINAVEEGREFKRFSKGMQKNSPKKSAKTIKGFHIGAATEKSSSISLSGGAVVIKPRPFFQFTDQQQQLLSQSFMRIFLDIFSDSIGVNS